MSCRELVVVVLALTASLGSARGDEPLTLGSAVAQALAQNAELRGAQAEVRAARARLEGASALAASNPELSAAVGPRHAGERRTIDYEIAVSQRVELAGQRGARIAAARAALGAVEARLAGTRSRVAAEVRELLGRVAASTTRIEVAVEAQRLAEQAERAAEQRFHAGDVARIEVNSARIERARAARATLGAEQERAAALAELELALGAEPGVPRDIAFQLAVEPSAPSSRGVDELVREALGARRDLVAARLEVDAAEAEARLAARAAVPSPALGVSFAREETADVVLGTVSIDLPVFARNQGERGVASARVEQARVALAALERRADREVRLAFARLEAARRTLAAFDAATAAAVGENLALATKAYEAGQLDFVRYLLLRREALDARRDHVDALEALNAAEAQLERALGHEPIGAAAPGASQRRPTAGESRFSSRAAAGR
jgi:outer membrane protein, heavy metal efflux system